MKEERVVEGRLGRCPAALAGAGPEADITEEHPGVQEDFLQIGCEGATGRAGGCVPRLGARLWAGMALRVDIPNLEVEWVF